VAGKEVTHCRLVARRDPRNESIVGGVFAGRLHLNQCGGHSRMGNCCCHGDSPAIFTSRPTMRKGKEGSSGGSRPRAPSGTARLRALSGTFTPRIRLRSAGTRARRGGPGCLNRFSASISGASAGVTLTLRHRRFTIPSSPFIVHADREVAACKDRRADAGGRLGPKTCASRVLSDIRILEALREAAVQQPVMHCKAARTGSDSSRAIPALDASLTRTD
jgi:hypothetical protein